MRASVAAETGDGRTRASVAMVVRAVIFTIWHPLRLRVERRRIREGLEAVQRAFSTAVP